MSGDAHRMTVVSGRYALGPPASGILGLIVSLALLMGDAPEVGLPGPAASSRVMPLYFVENTGRLPATVRFQGQGATSGVYFMRDRVRLVVDHGARADAVDLTFLGAGKGSGPVARSRSAGRVNYIGAAARDSLPTFREIAYRGVWPKVDVVFKGAGGRLEYAFVLHPGANLDDVQLAYRGAERVAVGGAGDLVVSTPRGAFTDSRPHAYQVLHGEKRPVGSRFAVHGTASYGFDVGAHDRSAPLVIDPGIAYAALVGPGEGEGVAVDGHGSAYVAGVARRGFPTTPGAYDESFNGFEDAFVTKLSPNGSSLVYSTVIGGSQGARAFGVDVDSSGSAYLVGDTTSADFPTTPGAFDRTYDPYEAFVAKLSPDGSSLDYSTFFGGRAEKSGEEVQTAFSVTIDEHGYAYVAGDTSSDTIPLSPGAVDTELSIHAGFAFKLNPQGSALEYSTLINSATYGSVKVAIDQEGNAYLAGEEIFNDVPVTPGAFDTQGPGRFEFGDDAFVIKLSPDATRIVYGTYLGGTKDDRGWGIAVNENGEATVAGDTASSDFPTTPGAQATSLAGDYDVFVTRLNASGSALVYSTYLGSRGYDGAAMDVTLDHSDRAIVTGNAGSADFPLTRDAADQTPDGGGDSFLAALDSRGGLSYSTYLPGGSGSDFPRSVAIDSRNDAYVTGGTRSANFQTTPAAYHFGSSDRFGAAFAVKVDLPPSDPATIALTPRDATNPVDTQHCVTATVRDQFGAPSVGVAVVFEVSGANRAGATRTSDAGGQASFCYTAELFGADRITAFADFNPRDGRRDALAFPPEPQDEASKTWELPESCKVKVNGSGSIEARNGDLASFKATLRAGKPGAANGTLRYSDRGPADRVEFRLVETLRIACGPSGEITVFGRGRVGGESGVPFRADLQDAGKPGRGNDSFRILLGTGYDSGRQLLVKGDLKVR